MKTIQGYLSGWKLSRDTYQDENYPGIPIRDTYQIPTPVISSTYPVISSDRLHQIYTRYVIRILLLSCLWQFSSKLLSPSFVTFCHFVTGSSVNFNWSYVLSKAVHRHCPQCLTTCLCIQRQQWQATAVTGAVTGDSSDRRQQWQATADSSDRRQQWQATAVTGDSSDRRQQWQTTAVTGDSSDRRQQWQATAVTGDSSDRRQQWQATAVTGDSSDRRQQWQTPVTGDSSDRQQWQAGNSNSGQQSVPVSSNSAYGYGQKWQALSLSLLAVAGSDSHCYCAGSACYCWQWLPLYYHCHCIITATVLSLPLYYHCWLYCRQCISLAVTHV